MDAKSCMLQASHMTCHPSGCLPEGDPMTSTSTVPALAALTGTYALDPSHSRIGFVARHAMVTKVRGAFTAFEGTAVLDGENTANSAAQVTIEVASINTGNVQRDG